MMIAESMERTVRKMETIWRRDNGDFDKMFPDLLDEARSDIERVRGLETVAPIDGELLKAFQEKGGVHEHCNS